jgi:pimeloyl-ACP methyl ester carboxylesterase
MTTMHDHTAQTEGQPRIRYWTAGRQGPRVLLVMGFSMRGEMWKPQIEVLSATHQVAWFDHRGLGESERGPKRVWGMLDMAGDALSVMDALGWQSAHLVGVSMGGMVAQELAIAHQERCASLGLLVTHAGGSMRRKMPPLAGMRAFAAANLKRSERRVEALRLLLYPEAYLAKVDPEVIRSRLAMQVDRPVPLGTILAQISAVLGHDSTQRLDRLTLPTLIVGAGLDVLIQPASAMRLKDAIPHAELMMLPHAGHGVIFQEARAVNAAIQAHILAATAAAKS